MTDFALLIGGAGDGSRVRVNGQWMDVAVMSECLPRVAYADEAVSGPFPFERHRYRLEWIRSGSQKFALYILNSMSHEDAMARLIAGYQGTGSGKVRKA